MKKNKVALLSSLAMVSLLVIGIVMATGLLKKKTINNEAKKNNLPEILGEFVESPPTSTPTPVNINQLIQSSLQNTKEVVMHTATEKVTEVEKIIINTINQEISNLSQSQIDALKLQICRDLGVITVAPTKQP